MNSSLRFAYEFSRDDDDFGWLAATVATPAFSARNGMWVQWQDLEEFAVTLATYPIPEEKPLSCEWGIGKGGDYEPITRLLIGPARPAGGLLAAVLLTNYDDTRDRCQTFFQTDYPSLARFGDEIQQMMRREAPAAVLGGFRTGER